MAQFLKLFKKLSFWLIVVFILSLVSIIVIGYLFALSTEIIVLSIIVLVSIFAMIFMLKSLLAARKSQKVEAAIKTQTTSKLELEKQQEIELFRNKMLSAIQALKKSRLSINITGKSNLYSMPWYMFFGPEGSGKTTLIARSGLEFPFGIETGITKDCDWFFTNSSVMIDTAGTLIEENDRGTASVEWYSLLEILGKYRKRQPLNGIVISVNLRDLINADPAEVESLAKSLRNRVNEVVQYSGFHLPLYIIFTSCDLLEGFEEFFQDMKDEETNQVWGYTLPPQKPLSEEMDSLFEKEFQNLYEVLLRFRLNNLSSIRGLDKQRKIYNFPEKFYSTKEILTRFTGMLFQANFYSENPLFRGFYFSSAAQAPLASQHASEEIEMQFNPETHITQHTAAIQKPRVYFLKDLFSRIIIPEQNLASPTSKSKFRSNIKNITQAAAIGLIIFLFIFNVMKNSGRNTESILTIKTIVNQVNQVDWNQKPEPAHFELLHELIAHNNRLQDKPFFGGSIYQGQRFSIPVNKLYVQKFTPFLSKYIYQNMLSGNLNDYLRGSSDIKRDQAYEYLRGYLLLDTYKQKLYEDESEFEFIRNLMASLVNSLFEQEFKMAYQSQFNEKNISSLKTLNSSEVDYFVDILSNEESAKWDLPFKNDDKLVKRVRRKLGKPDISDIYARIKREGLVHFKRISINQILSESAADVFEEDASISGFYTKNAWENHISDKIEQVSKNPGRDDWVLDVAASDLPLELQDADVMVQKLQQRYFQDYTRAWWEFMRQVKYIPFKDVRTAAEQFSILGDFMDSPLRKILEIVSIQTKYEGLLDKKAKQLKDKLGIKAGRYSVDEQFRFVHSLSEDEGGSLAKLLGQFDDVGGLLETLIDDPGENTALYVASVIKQRSGETPAALQSIRRSLRRFNTEARESIFEKPISMSWIVLLEKTQQYLDQQWTEQIYQPYQTNIADHYPINKNSDTEIPPADIAQFFKKNDGTFWNFIKDEIEPFLKKKSWNPDNWEGHGIEISEEFKILLQKVLKITEGLGLENQDNLKLNFKILPELPLSKIGNVEQVVLSIDGKELVYRMGRPAWENFYWPNQENVSSSRLEVRTRIASYKPQQFDGSWSWFRLLDRAIVHKSTSSKFNVEWRFPPDRNYEIQVRFKISANSINNPFGSKDFFNISLPVSISTNN